MNDKNFQEAAKLFHRAESRAVMYITAQRRASN